MDESVVKEFEQQQVGKLKASEAIRIGAKLRPQCRKRLCVSGATCAMGAAYEAFYGECPSEGHEPYTRLWSAFPELRQHRIAIWEMNDKQRMTREQIADWLEAKGL